LYSNPTVGRATCQLRSNAPGLLLVKQLSEASQAHVLSGRLVTATCSQ